MLSSWGTWHIFSPVLGLQFGVKWASPNQLKRPLALYQFLETKTYPSIQWNITQPWKGMKSCCLQQREWTWRVLCWVEWVWQRQTEAMWSHLLEPKEQNEPRNRAEVDAEIQKANWSLSDGGGWGTGWGRRGDWKAQIGGCRVVAGSAAWRMWSVMLP